MLSLVYFTYRPGGIDLLVDSLAKQTFRDFEVILVDDWPERDRERVWDYFKKNDVLLGWQGVSKTKCYPDTQFNQANAINTGLLHCSPDSNYIVVMSDFGILRPTCMMRWSQFANDSLRQRWAVTGIGYVWRTPHAPVIDSVMTFAKPLNLRKCQLFQTWIPEKWEMFYFGMPRFLWEEMNGVDERVDQWREFPVTHFQEQAAMLGISVKVDAKNAIDMLHHREWGGELWHINNKPKAGESYRPGHRPTPTPYSQNDFLLWARGCAACSTIQRP